MHQRIANVIDARKLTKGVVSLSFVIVGICCSYQILAICKVSTFVRTEVAGLATAVANMIIMIFGYFFHTVMGSVINYMGGPGESQALMYGVSVIPIALSFGTAAFIFIYAKQEVVGRTPQKAV